MARVQNEGSAITLKTRNQSTSFSAVETTDAAGSVTSAAVTFTYVKTKFYLEGEGEEQVERVVNQQTLTGTTTLEKPEETEIDYETGISAKLSTLL
tara:strand:+ start:293 stop:580 length:288 start_codon:yes stop_codon:yes gene_type:complete